MYKTKDITKADLKALAIKNQDEIVALTGSELDPVKAWEVIKQASDNFTKSDLKAQEADELLFEMLYPDEKSNTGEIYTMSDGFQWKLLSKAEAKKRFIADKEVYGIDRDTETEALIESKEDAIAKQFIDQGGYGEFVIEYNPVTQTLWFGNKSSQFEIVNNSKIFQLKEDIQDEPPEPEELQLVEEQPVEQQGLMARRGM